MEQGLTNAPCDELTEEAHRLFAFLTKRRDKRNIAGPFLYQELAKECRKSETYWNIVRREDIPELKERLLLQALGDGFFLLTETCPHQGFWFSAVDSPENFLPNSLRSMRLQGESSARRALGSPSEGVVASDGRLSGGDVIGVNGYPLRGEGSYAPQNVYDLIRHLGAISPDFDAGNRREFGTVLKNMRAMQRRGIRFYQLKAMVEEFARHPEWCRKSDRQPSVVFAIHQAQLLALVNRSTRMHAVENHRHTRGYWTGMA